MSSSRKKGLSNHCVQIGKSGSGSTFQSTLVRMLRDRRLTPVEDMEDPPAATNWSFQWKSYDDLMIIAIRIRRRRIKLQNDCDDTRGGTYVRIRSTWWLEALTTSSIIESDPRAFDFIVVGYLSLCVSLPTAFGNWVPDKWQLCNSSIDGKLAVYVHSEVRHEVLFTIFSCLCTMWCIWRGIIFEDI